MGNEAIAQCLKAEAAGMLACPQALTVGPNTELTRRVVVEGHVKAIVFQVNTAWIFDLRVVQGKDHPIVKQASE